MAMRLSPLLWSREGVFYQKEGSRLPCQTTCLKIHGPGAPGRPRFRPHRVSRDCFSFQSALQGSRDPACPWSILTSGAQPHLPKGCSQHSKTNAVTASTQEGGWDLFLPNENSEKLGNSQGPSQGSPSGLRSPKTCPASPLCLSPPPALLSESLGLIILGQQS